MHWSQMFAFLCSLLFFLIPIIIKCLCCFSFFTMQNSVVTNTCEQITFVSPGTCIISVNHIPRSYIARVDREESKDKCYEHLYSLWEIIAKLLPRSVISFNQFIMPLSGSENTLALVGNGSLAAPVGWFHLVQISLPDNWRAYIYLRLYNYII